MRAEGHEFAWRRRGCQNEIGRSTDRNGMVLAGENLVGVDGDGAHGVVDREMSGGDQQ